MRVPLLSVRTDYVPGRKLNRADFAYLETRSDASRAVTVSFRSAHFKGLGVRSGGGPGSGREPASLCLAERAGQGCGLRRPPRSSSFSPPTRLTPPSSQSERPLSPRREPPFLGKPICGGPLAPTPGLGFRVWGLEFRVYGLRFRV